jgi:Ca2+-binding EF-hand superfamily protein
LNWAFKLYDVDNDGMIDLHEMSVIMETLDSIEGIKPGNVCRESLTR